MTSRRQFLSSAAALVGLGGIVPKEMPPFRCSWLGTAPPGYWPEVLKWIAFTKPEHYFPETNHKLWKPWKDIEA